MLFFGGGKAMELENLDKLRRAKDLINGLQDMMIYIEDARQDKLIPVTVLCPFEAVLEKAFLMLDEVEKMESEQEGCP